MLRHESVLYSYGLDAAKASDLRQSVVQSMLLNRISFKWQLFPDKRSTVWKGCLESEESAWWFGQDTKTKREGKWVQTASSLFFTTRRKTDSTSSPHTSQCLRTPTGSHFGSQPHPDCHSVLTGISADKQVWAASCSRRRPLPVLTPNFILLLLTKVVWALFLVLPSVFNTNAVLQSKAKKQITSLTSCRGKKSVVGYQEVEFFRLWVTERKIYLFFFIFLQCCKPKFSW